MTERATTERSTTAHGAVQSVDRAVQVLETIAREDGASVAAIARELEVHASTASRLVASLERHDLVERGDDGAVQLGVGLLRLASAARPRRDPPRSRARSARRSPRSSGRPSTSRCCAAASR